MTEYPIERLHLTTGEIIEVDKVIKLCNNGYRVLTMDGLVLLVFFNSISFIDNGEVEGEVETKDDKECRYVFTLDEKRGNLYDVQGKYVTGVTKQHALKKYEAGIYE